MAYFLAAKCINFQYQMQQEVQLKYINQDLQIGMVNWREVYLLSPKPVELIVEVDKGRLVYRAKGSSRRFTYKKMKNGLKKTRQTFHLEVPDWLCEVPPHLFLKK